jgi:hypothetical protein
MFAKSDLLAVVPDDDEVSLLLDLSLTILWLRLRFIAHKGV